MGRIWAALLVGERVRHALARRRVRLADGQTLERDALFFYVGWQLRTDLARALGCKLRDYGSIVVDSDQATTVDRVYAAGNSADPGSGVAWELSEAVVAWSLIAASTIASRRRPLGP